MRTCPSTSTHQVGEHAADCLPPANENKLQAASLHVSGILSNPDVADNDFSGHAGLPLQNDYLRAASKTPTSISNMLVAHAGQALLLDGCMPCGAMIICPAIMRGAWMLN